MVSYSAISVGKNGDVNVLILIVVDDGLVHFAGVNPYELPQNVLILIVVDDGLVHFAGVNPYELPQNVLILIVVDDGLVLDLIRHY